MRSLDEKVDSIAADIGTIKITMAVNTSELALHVKRTDLLEAQVAKYERTVQRAQGLGIAAGALGWIIATAATLMEVWRGLHGS